MKKREIYADLRCLPPVIIRADGRNFKNTLSRLDFEKPYDKRFASAMAGAVELLFKKSGLSPSFAYTFSDEVNLLFLDTTFDGRVEKLDSVIPSYLSSALTILLGLEEPISFDSRIIPISSDKVSEYMVWRQREAWRNCISSYGYYTLRREGLGKKEATSLLRSKKANDLHEMMFERGINLAKVPAWQRRGVVVHKEEYEITGYNPVLDEKTTTKRTRVVQNWEIPLFGSEEGEEFLNRFINVSP